MKNKAPFAFTNLSKALGSRKGAILMIAAVEERSEEDCNVEFHGHG